MEKSQTHKLNFLKTSNNDSLFYSHFSWRKIDKLQFN